ncbi:MAG: SDR family oxidoreductase [Propionibacteriaceae bacterium]
MRVAIAGGHGQIALIIQSLLSQAGHEAIGIIRNADHAAELLTVGGIPLVLDLENTDVDTLAQDLDGVDAVVFAAGGGPNSGAARKLTVDRDGAILLADAAQQQGIKRYVMISAMGADGFEPDSEDVFQVYLRAKSEADADLRARDLDWTIVRPGGLTNDEPTGTVQIAESTGSGSIPRADVAALVVQALADGLAVRQQFEVISGDTAIGEALTELSAG